MPFTIDIRCAKKFAINLAQRSNALGAAEALQPQRTGHRVGTSDRLKDAYQSSPLETARTQRSVHALRYQRTMRISICCAASKKGADETAQLPS